MTNVKALVVGCTGQVGWELRHKLVCLGPVTGVDYPQVDFTQPDSIRQAVRAAAPAVIVNAAAYTAVDKAETDYVFDGAKQGPYVESDVPHPLNVYGRTKLAGDEAIQAVGGDYLILRTSWVYGARGNNFLLTMLRLARERAELRIVDDQIGSPTTSECIAQATAGILAQVLGPAAGGLKGRSGIYNLTCAGETTWFGFARALLTKSAASHGFTVPNLIPITTGEFPRPAKRPANSRLRCQRVEETFGVVMPDWEEALALVLETLGVGAGLVGGNG